MTQKLVITIAFLALVSSCYQPRPRDPHVPVVASQEACDTACAHLASMGCEEAEPTPRGATCAEICYATDSTGWSNWGAACVTRAASCDAARRCR